MISSFVICKQAAGQQQDNSRTAAGQQHHVVLSVPYSTYLHREAHSNKLQDMICPGSTGDGFMHACGIISILWQNLPDRSQLS
jgi:hypothetical protein